MKKQLLFVVIILVSLSTYAQVGIGTKSPSEKAILHVDGSNNLGLIVPQVDDTASVKIEDLKINADDTVKVKRAAGLLVYQRADSAFYYWDKYKWQCVNPFETNSSTGEITPSRPYNKVVGNFEGTADLEGSFSGNVSGNVDGELNATGTNSFGGNGTVPIGGIIMWSGTKAPAGWAICDGYWYDPNNNASFRVSEDATHNIKTPDLQGKFVLGYEKYKYSPGNEGGNESITITNQNLPAHQHQMSSDGATASITGGSHTHDVADVSANKGGDNRVAVRGENWDGTYDYIANSSTHSHPNSEFSGNTGNGVNCNNTAIDIRPPYYVLAFIMRIR